VTTDSSAETVSGLRTGHLVQPSGAGGGFRERVGWSPRHRCREPVRANFASSATENAAGDPPRLEGKAAERVVAGGDRSSGASVAGGHSPSPAALAAGSGTPTGRWRAARRSGIRSGGRLDARTTMCTLDTKAQLARGVEQLDHVRHAGAPVLSAPSPRHTDCRARAPLAGISPSSFSNLLPLSRSLASSSCSISFFSSRSLSPSQDSTA